MPTRKNFALAAKIVSELDGDRDAAYRAFVLYFAKLNPRFDSARFSEACFPQSRECPEGGKCVFSPDEEYAQKKRCEAPICCEKCGQDV